MVQVNRPSNRPPAKFKATNVVLCCLVAPLLLLVKFGLKFSNNTAMNPTQMFRNSDSNTKSIPIQPILRHIGLSSDALFPMLLQSHPQPTESTVVIEVGCFRLQQSLLAAKNGFRTYSVEASPTNYKQMTTRHDQLLTEDKKAHDLITILNKAGSAKSRQVLTFDAIGGTGE